MDTTDQPRAVACIRFVRLCCGQAHDGPTCPDGKVMCCLCFDRFEVSSLNVTEGGTPENVCKECAEMEANVSDQTRAEVGVADTTDALRRVVCIRFVRPVVAVDPE